MKRAAVANHGYSSAISLALVACLGLAPTVARADGTAPSASIPPTSPGVRVHIRASTVQYLLRSPDDGGTWVEACQSPCDTELPLADLYRVGNSKKFRLYGAPGEAVELRVDPPAKRAMVGGGTVAGLGFLTSLIATLILSGTDWGCSPAAPGTTCNNNAGLSTVAIAAGAGAAIGVAGLVVMLTSSRTDVTAAVFVPAPSQPAAVPPQPSWHVGSSPAPASAPAFTLPIFATSF